MKMVELRWNRLTMELELHLTTAGYKWLLLYSGTNATWPFETIDYNLEYAT